MAAALVRAGIKGIERAGEAGQGDRTMLDALVPLLEALQSAAQRGEPPVAGTIHCGVSTSTPLKVSAKSSLPSGEMPWSVMPLEDSARGIGASSPPLTET